MNKKNKKERCFIFFIFFLIIFVFFRPEKTKAAVIFQSNADSASTCQDIFYDANCYGGGACAVSTTQANSGTKSIRLTYGVNEAGCELKPEAFSSTTSLFTRKYEFYDSNWTGNWPIGLKTSRYFTTSDWSTGSEPSAYAYASEKLIWQTYGATCSENYGMGLNVAILNLDLEDTYGAGENFGNGLPYIRAGRWYKYETWMVLNSGVNVADGVLKIWIDDVLVYDNNSVVWKSSLRGVPNGSGWQSMWFGGNYSGATCGNPSTTLYRYIDDVYLSTTLDRGAADTTPPAAPTGLSVN
jgi:hypothetical protein